MIKNAIVVLISSCSAMAFAGEKIKVKVNMTFGYTATFEGYEKNAEGNAVALSDQTILKELKDDSGKVVETNIKMTELVRHMLFAEGKQHLVLFSAGEDLVKIGNPFFFFMAAKEIFGSVKPTLVTTQSDANATIIILDKETLTPLQRKIGDYVFSTAQEWDHAIYSN